MNTLGLKEVEKFLWESREKGLPCWLSQFSKTNWNQTNIGAKLTHWYMPSIC
jgi:hypothetical protein